MMGRLVVINMSQQSDSADLLGGFKPVDVRALAEPVIDEFRSLFFRTFSRKQNAAFMTKVCGSVGGVGMALVDLYDPARSN